MILQLLDCDTGEVANNCMHSFLTGARLVNLMPYNIMEGAIQKWKCASVSMEFCYKYLEIASLENGEAHHTKSEVIRQCFL